MTVLEKQIEARLVERIKERGGLCLKWVCPGWAGVPDRIVLLPGGKIYFVELKRPKDGSLSPRQEWWGEKLTGLGFEYYTIWDYADLTLFIEGKVPSKGVMP